MIKALYKAIYTALNGAITVDSVVVPVSSQSFTNASRSIQLLSYAANPTDTKKTFFKNVIVNIECVTKDETPDVLASIVSQVEAIMKPTPNSVLTLDAPYSIVFMKSAIHLQRTSQDEGQSTESTTLRYEFEIQTL